MKYLITGGCGFIGSNLAAEVLKRGEKLFVLDNLFRYGSSSNLEWLRTKGDFTYYPYDTRKSLPVMFAKNTLMAFLNRFLWIFTLLTVVRRVVPINTCWTSIVSMV